MAEGEERKRQAARREKEGKRTYRTTNIACVFQHHGQKVITRSNGRVLRLRIISICSSSRSSGMRFGGVGVGSPCIAFVKDLFMKRVCVGRSGSGMAVEMEIGLVSRGVPSPTSVPALLFER